MLTLSRKHGQALKIGDVVAYFRVEGGRVKVSLDAPEDVPILRGECAGLPDFATYAQSQAKPAATKAAG